MATPEITLPVPAVVSMTTPPNNDVVSTRDVAMTTEMRDRLLSLPDSEAGNQNIERLFSLPSNVNIDYSHVNVTDSDAFADLLRSNKISGVVTSGNKQRCSFDCKSLPPTSSPINILPLMTVTCTISNVAWDTSCYQLHGFIQPFIEPITRLGKIKFHLILILV